MKTILILGVTSNIGFAFYQQYRDKYNIYGLCRNWPLKADAHIKEVAYFDFENIKSTIDDISPDIVVNCVGLNDVDKCESNMSMSNEFNFDFVKLLINAASQSDSKLVFFSSSQIYSGDKTEYSETDKPSAVNVYGQSKAHAEHYISDNCSDFLLLRLTTVISPRQSFQRNNLSNFIIDGLISNTPLKLICDDLTNFVCVNDVVSAMNLLFYKNSIGVFNIAGDEKLSRYGLGKLIASKVKTSWDIEKVSSTEFKTVARRPIRLVLSNNKLKKEIDFTFSKLADSIESLLKDKN